jgi:hypothetical protein
MDVMNLKNIAKHYHEIEGLLMHAYETENRTRYYVLISYDKNDNEIKRKTFINFTKKSVEPYIQTKLKEDWCYIHNEEMDCYNEEGKHDDYRCFRCENNGLSRIEKCNEDLKKHLKEDLKKMFHQKKN